MFLRKYLRTWLKKLFLKIVQNLKDVKVFKNSSELKMLKYLKIVQNIKDVKVFKNSSELKRC